MTGDLNIHGAAELMHQLNLMTGELKAPERYRIYALKTDLIERLYRAGFCAAVVPESRTVTCYCRHRNPDCPRCGGKGIRTLLYYRFCFDMGDGHRYIWHQPEAQVTWPINLTEDVPQGWHGASLSDPVNSEDAEDYAATLEAWLKSTGQGVTHRDEVL